MLEFRTLGRLDLRDDAGMPVNSVLAHPKRAAVLAYLAVARAERCYRRDSVLGVFWPEIDGERARASLRKTIHFLRRSLGAEVLQSVSDDEICLADGALRCDAAELLQHAEEGRHADAIALYRGEFMDGFFLLDSPDFDAWLEQQRTRIRNVVFASANVLAERAEEEGDNFAAAMWARRALELAPVDETALRRLLLLLDRLGDRAGAVAAYEDFARRLQRDYEIETSAETQLLFRRIRDVGDAPEPARKPVQLPVEPVLEEAQPQAAQQVIREEISAAPPRKTQRRWFASAAAGGAAIAMVWALFLRADDVIGPLAVGEVRDYTASGQETLAGPLADMLATNLARIRGLTVISSARVYELTGDTTETAGGAILAAARRAGAGQVVEGTLYRQSGGSLRFDVRVINLRSGTLRVALSVEGRDVFALVDRATSEVASALQMEPVPRGVADVTTRSLAAYRLYEEGLREFYQRGDPAAAQRLFLAALREDSTFAMASYYAFRTEVDLRDVSTTNLQRALRHASRATDRERLLIVSTARRAWGEPGALAAAETLSIRYPAEPDGHYMVGESLVEAGEFSAAVPHLRRVIDMDLPQRAAKPRFRAQDAYGLMLTAYMHADSFATAERVAREYVRLYPGSVVALRQLAAVLMYLGNDEEAEATLRAADKVVPLPAQAAALRLAQMAMQHGAYARADSILERVRSQGTAADRASAEWWLMISLREQGKQQAALALARQSVATGDRDQINMLRTTEAQILLEQGRAAEAARLFEETAAHSPWADWQKGKTARHQAWRLTHAATAYAAAGDTTQLTRLEPTIRTTGAASGYGRDQRLHYYVSGLAQAAAGRLERAASSYRAALYSPTQGFTRTNYELAKTLTALGRPQEAVATLQPAFRGGLEASNMYVTRTELHEQLAIAFEALQQRDSARAHYQAVATALKNSEPQWVPRRTAALAALRRLIRDTDRDTDRNRPHPLAVSVSQN